MTSTNTHCRGDADLQGSSNGAGADRAADPHADPEWSDELRSYERRRGDPETDTETSERLDDAELRALAMLIANTVAGAG